MNDTTRLLRTSRVLFFLAVLWIAGAIAAFGQQQQGRPLFKVGEILLYCKPGTPPAAVDELSALVQAQSVTPLLLADCYKLDLPVARRTEADTTQAVTTLKADPRVRWVNATPIKYPLQAGAPTDEPNDPRYRSGEQWNLAMMNMPQAWALQKGQPNVNIACVDTGFRPTHEDATGRFHSASFDFADNDSDITADGNNVFTDHGTGTSGIFIANTNNNLGIAGICWENIQCIGYKCYNAGQTAVGFNGVALINSYVRIAQTAQQNNIAVCNLSLGGPGDPNDVTNPEYIAVKAMVDAGVIVVASAGNDTADASGYTPAGYPFVVSVSAVGPTKALAPYSNFGKINIAAPGGDQTSALADGILSLAPNNAYDFTQGTSDAAPHVSGVFGLLRSVPGVTPAQAIQAVQDTGNLSGITVGPLPDRNYGFGIIDAYRALLKVSVTATVIDPVGVDTRGRTTDPSGIAPPTETFRPLIRLQIANVPLSGVTVKVDDETLSESFLSQNIESGNPTGTNPIYTIAFRRSFSTESPFQHRIDVSATNSATATTATDTRIFTISPFVIQPGLSMVSFPFFESASDSPTGQFRQAGALLGNDITLYRYKPLPLGVPYVTYTNATTGQDMKPLTEAFQPTDVQTPVEDSTSPADTRPVGLGYFVRANTTVPVETFGTSFNTRAFRIPLHEGWNLVGDPFAYPVALSSTLIETRNGERITIQQAADNKVMLPFLWRFVGTEYQFRTLSDAAFVPWEGHWLYVLPKNPQSLNSDTVATLIVLPTKLSLGNVSGRGAKSPSRASSVSNGMPRVGGPGSWTLRLSARSKDLTDSYNFIGMSNRGSDADDMTKVPKPPRPGPFVNLGITRATAPGAIYAQDVRTLGGTKSWDLLVNTDQPNSDVTLTWSDIRALPRNYRLTLTDKVTGQTVDLRNQSAYQFNSGAVGGSRSFQLTARPSLTGSKALLTNVFVNPSRASNGRSAATYEIGYFASRDVRVEASILTFGGRVLTQVGGTRAATVGENRIVWNGRDNAGRVASAGTYVLQLRAITPEGDITRVTYPLVITGR